VRREPVGVVAAVIPWNAPHQSALVKVIPALLAGCTVILKPSPETALDGLLLGELFTEAGFPEGVVSILPAGRETSEYLISHPGIDKVAFTGSTAAGRRIASIAAGQLKRVSLELGGKSATIALDDADPSAVARGVPAATFVNNGESCIAQTRLLVPRSRYEEFVDAVAAVARQLTVGDPADPASFIGPPVTAAQKAKVQSYIQSGIDDGACLVVGGPGAPEGLEQGNYVRPTVFADVDNKIANDSPYGLSGGVWSANRERALSVARRIRTGTFTVNGAHSSFDAPFGGYKSSGFGREMGIAGLNQYIELKTITL
jgi:acyl-CoA reductase-like NAD-dependent aldehyde dehydrogenase